MRLHDWSQTRSSSGNIIQATGLHYNTIMMKRVKTILRFILVAIMVGGFLVQMWDLFDQFHSGLKTIAVSFEERDALEFPSFAICDSRAHKKLTPKTANAERYNTVTYNLEGQISLFILSNNDDFSNNDFSNNNDLREDWNNYTTELVPTIYNGYCMLYELQRSYPVDALACNFYKHRELVT